MPISAERSMRFAGRHGVRLLLDLLRGCDEHVVDVSRRLLPRAMNALLQLWCEPGFVARSPLPHHRHVTHTMLHALDMIDGTLAQRCAALAFHRPNNTVLQSASPSTGGHAVCTPLLLEPSCFL